MAGEWACKNGVDGYINRYVLDLGGLRLLNLLDKQYNILNWLALLLANRTFRLTGQLGMASRAYILENFLPDISDADVIIGYRADDSYFSYAQAFVENTLSLNVLQEALYLGKLGEQVVLRSADAYANLKFLDVELAMKDKYYPLFKMRDDLARRQYHQELSKKVPAKDDLFILDIMRRELKNDDLCL